MLKINNFRLSDFPRELKVKKVPKVSKVPKVPKVFRFGGSFELHTKTEC